MRPALALGVALILVASGCGPVALLHDAYIGPISPVGTIHRYVVTEHFEITELGPVADYDPYRDGLLRPFPPNMLQRSSLIPMARGIEVVTGGLSFVTERHRTHAAPLTADQQRALRLGMSRDDAIRACGVPAQWIGREEGTILTYPVHTTDHFEIHAGVPPGIVDLIPIPGIQALSFVYNIREAAVHSAVLFFDRDDVLRAFAVAPHEPAQGDDP
jgi:hypothetical protein